jgi:hypothetical protein
MVDMPEIHWENAIPEAERAAVAAALRHPGVVEATLARLYNGRAVPSGLLGFSVRHVATGGAKRVYLVMLRTPQGESYPFVLKQFLPKQLAHLPPGATIGGTPTPAVGLDGQLLARMVWAAQRVDAIAPDLCPRFGGFWEWVGENGQRHRAMTEAYVEGRSLDGWKTALEDRFIRGELDFAQCTEQRRILERQAIAAYVRLWDILGRQTFTSDPSPWNILLVPVPEGYRLTIIDLHSIHDGGTPLYVFQTLEECFGNRDEIREHALCPGILDALGEQEGRRFLETVHVELEAQTDGRRRTGLSSYVASSRAIARFLSRRR